ncbi:hypothetical protein AO390_27245 [Pseudomonas marginalis ICMP 11289]|nr:hypothetical protein AO390_27245 [Pseudomonas marginalis ICMP 11289]
MYITFCSFAKKFNFGQLLPELNKAGKQVFAMTDFFKIFEFKYYRWLFRIIKYSCFFSNSIAY